MNIELDTFFFSKFPNQTCRHDQQTSGGISSMIATFRQSEQVRDALVSYMEAMGPKPKAWSPGYQAYQGCDPIPKG